MGDWKFTTLVFIEPFDALKPMGVLKTFSRRQSQCLMEKGKLDTSVIHGDGTTTAAKKGGDNLEFSGHKHMKGDKVGAFCDGQKPT